MKQIGIIGGMGPLATIDLYNKIVSLTPATCDQKHIHVVIDSYPQIEDRTKFIIDNEKSPIDKLVESAKRLKTAGCDAIIISCNTAHYFAEEIEKQANVKILYITKIAIEAIKKIYPNAKDIAVIATSGTKKGRVYDKILEENGLNSVSFTNEQQKALMDCIYKGVKAGKTKDYVSLFNKIISEIKADVYIAACTEIPMFLEYLDKPYNFIDATLELAKYTVNYALEK
ncbi:aspartate racemase [Campylobacter pinnipediorum subsp. pinnipediorum]|uniref:Aspartate racemase n=1 Tax=Campylobacter pinnipediorum subsp. pinnipediorum TaxID=1660067 RepID=A0AAX0LA29_9BACT|nr:amino acid racemase [Campylobacter pinnipediorum]AQW81166.1 aspartate racemase [Campylobacter pinnipediorum subsp. pinnipediorum]OPA77953.1 aspartate racemase [Campylobacter pinnipediorum subsp. pinnipediorum]OPA78118.1 aspartate racemase [Campylobacter pinnipediorum subsp. pinnipediorum]